MWIKFGDEWHRVAEENVRQPRALGAKKTFCGLLTRLPVSEEPVDTEPKCRFCEDLAK